VLAKHPVYNIVKEKMYCCQQISTIFK